MKFILQEVWERKLKISIVFHTKKKLKKLRYRIVHLKPHYRPPLPPTHSHTHTHHYHNSLIEKVTQQRHRPYQKNLKVQKKIFEFSIIWSQKDSSFPTTQSNFMIFKKKFGSFVISQTSLELAEYVLFRLRYIVAFLSKSIVSIKITSHFI